MPPRRDPSPLSSPFLVGLITDDSAAPNYSWVEAWDDGTGVLVEKTAARYGDKDTQPGVDVLGVGFTSGDAVYVRSADGNGGLSWELYPIGDGTSPPPPPPAAASSWKTSARVSTTAALPANTYANGSSGVGATLTGNSNGALAAQDGITLVAGDTVLVRHETATHNGKYVVTQVGDASHPYILTRTTDADSFAAVQQMVVAVREGTLWADSVWMNTDDVYAPAPAIGSANITFRPINHAPQEVTSVTVYDALAAGSGPTSFSVPLPEAGTYELVFRSDLTFVVSSNPGGISAGVNLYNVTSGSSVSLTDLPIYMPNSDTQAIHPFVITKQVAVTVPTTIALAYTGATTGPTYLVVTINTYGTVMSWRRIK